MSDVPKCKSWLGHKFEARYSTTNPSLLRLIERSSSVELHPYAITKMREETYECDVCVRCGQVVRPQVENVQVISAENTT